jgi:hypothetical protein
MLPATIIDLERVSRGAAPQCGNWVIESGPQESASTAWQTAIGREGALVRGPPLGEPWRRGNLEGTDGHLEAARGQSRRLERDRPT